MSSLNNIRQFVNERLAAAAQEIFGVFQLTVSGLEEELERQRELVELLRNPLVHLPLEDVQTMKPDNLPEHQGPSLDHEEQDCQQNQDEILQNAPLVQVKVEDDAEREEETLTSSLTQHIKTEADEDDCGGPGPAMYSEALLNSLHQRSLSLQHDPSNNGYWREPVETQPGLDSIEHQEFSQVTNDYQPASYSGSLSKGHHKTRNEQAFICSICGKHFALKRSLNAHMIIHSGEKPFSCSHCGKCFNQRHNLKVHMRLHSGEKPYCCSKCGDSFMWLHELKRHMTSHTGENPFTCSHCGKCFNQRHNLKAHMRIHSGEKPYHCPQCDKCFRQRSALSSHMRLHSGEKPHRCSQCGDHFSWSYQLKHHMTLHMVEKPS